MDQPMKRCAPAVLTAALAMMALPAGSASWAAGDVPSDAPALADYGEQIVGFREIALTNPSQSLPGGVTGERSLPLAVWYPAQGAADSHPACYSFSPPPIPNQAAALADQVSECGNALADAPPVGGGHPVVVISHGYGGWATGFSWLAENLASKGYVVIAIDHRDLPANTPAQQAMSFATTVMTRSDDQRFVIEALAARAMPQWLNDLSDPQNIALIAYSMGGFGALATAGAPYDRSGALNAALQGNVPATGAAPAGLKALVLFAPWGGAAPLRAWSADDLARITVPSLVLVGREDDIVTYAGGVDWIFDAMTGAQRLMIVYDAARHNIAANAVPKALASSFDYRERLDEPVWRKDRLNAINAHFITALLDRRLKGDAAAGEYLRLPSPRAEDGRWPLEPGSVAGDARATAQQPDYWPGFQRRWAVGMSQRTGTPGTPSSTQPEQGGE